MSKKSIVGIAILVILLMVGLSLGPMAYRYYTAEIRGIVDAEVTIESSESRITNYERFFDMCSNVQALKETLNAQERRLERTDSSESSTVNRILSNIAGIEANIARQVVQYNALAEQHYTSARFMDQRLPPRLYTTGETVCIR